MTKTEELDARIASFVERLDDLSEEIGLPVEELGDEAIALVNLAVSAHIERLRETIGRLTSPVAMGRIPPSGLDVSGSQFNDLQTVRRRVEGEEDEIPETS